MSELAKEPEGFRSGLYGRNRGGETVATRATWHFKFYCGIELARCERKRSHLSSWSLNGTFNKSCAGHFRAASRFRRMVGSLRGLRRPNPPRKGRHQGQCAEAV